MKELVSLKDLMIFYLHSLLQTELLWVSVIEERVDQVHSPALKELFKKAVTVSKNHIKTLTETLKGQGEAKSTSKSVVVKGLIFEMNEMMELGADPEVRDAGLILIQQSMNHYKMVRYGSVCSYAKLLGQDKNAEILHTVLDEEKALDEAFTQVAEAKINPQALLPILI